jgi:cytoskeletal protein CcmA (bactofilin family)
MGATYTRQSTYAEGDVIQASDTNDEFDQLLAAFAASTGHTHDGTTGEGGPISTMAGHSLTFGAGTAGTDITLTFDGESNDGVLKWMEDEDYFEFSDDILVASTEKLQFRDTAIYINSSADGQLDLVADTEIQIAATTIDINGAADISGNLAVGGNLTVAGNATVTGTTTFNGGTLTLGDSASDNVVFGADVDSSIIPDDDDTYDLGSSSQQWRNIFIDGTAEIDTLSLDGTAVTSTAAELNILDGVTSTAAELNIVDGNTSATSTTVADADRVVLNDNGTMVQVAVTDLAAYFDDEITAMPNLVTTAATTVGALNSGSITSGFGTIDTGSSTITTTGLITGGSLDIDDVVINGSTIGHTDDTDLITVANGIATVAGELSVTTLDIGGTNVTATATELNLLDGVTSTTAELNILDGVTSTAAELNTLDGITAVVGELNALDLGSTAVGTAIASKAVVLDSNKDYTGIRNLTLTGDLTIGGDDLTMATNTAGHILVADGTNFNPIAVTDLTEISTAADGDVLLAVDASGGGLKKITRSTIIAGTGSSGDLANVVEDTSPQLGGNLDVQTNSIVSTSNRDISITPNGSGKVVLDGNVGIESGLIDLKNSGAVSKIKFYCESSNAHAQTLQGAPHSESASNTLTLPSTGGDVNLVSTASTATLTNKTFGDNVSFGDNNITNVGDIALDSISADGTDINVAVTDNSATAFTIKQGSDAYFVVDTGNSSESVSIGTGVSGTAITLGHSTSEVTVADNLTVTGDLTVSGTTTTVNSTTVNLNDHNIVLDSGNSTSAVINGAGITIEGGSGDDATFTYNTTGPKFELKLGSSHEDLQVAQLIATSLDISGDVDVDGTLETDALSINGTAVTASAADINLIDGITNGTVIASKAIITDSNKDISGGRNITISGELDAATLDISGNADIDGTLEADAITVNGTALNTVIAGVTVANATTAAVATTVTITDNESTNEDNAVIFTAGGDVDGGNIGLESDGNLTYNPSTGRLTATQLSGTLQTAAQTNITSVGALNGGSITSGFGTINTGSSAITTTGLISGGSLDIDNVLINGSTIGHTDDTDLITVADGLVTVAGEVSLTTLDIGGTNVTSTAAELNILDGVTSTAAELNILDGVTATASELNLLDGGTSVGSSITLADADGFVVNDNGTMKTIPASDVKTYAAGSAATKGFAIAMAIVFG